MEKDKTTEVILENDKASLKVASLGGAITSFILKDIPINLLNFSFTREQMPPNNQDGAVYQGHFACIGRWGPPSPGEIAAGIPDHGEPANLQWKTGPEELSAFRMSVTALKEGIEVQRRIILDPESPVYLNEETITNINPLGRLFNIVQHPTFAAPLLDNHTLVDCNAEEGFSQSSYRNIAENKVNWPQAMDEKGNAFNLRNPEIPCGGVYSYVVKKGDYGWITAYFPSQKLLIGYIWKRSDYPWIHLWLDYEKDQIKYRGLEFGTAGIHQPYQEILKTATSVLGEKTFTYLEPGEPLSKRFLSFLIKVPEGFSGVEGIHLKDSILLIQPKAGTNNLSIPISKTISDELQG